MLQVINFCRLHPSSWWPSLALAAVGWGSGASSRRAAPVVPAATRLGELLPAASHTPRLGCPKALPRTLVGRECRSRVLQGADRGCPRCRCCRTRARAPWGTHAEVINVFCQLEAVRASSLQLVFAEGVHAPPLAWLCPGHKSGGQSLA